MKHILIAFSVCLLILCSCATTEEYKDDAASEAREFIFDNVNHISMDNYNYIKYTYPRILKKEIFLTHGQEYNRYYFAWDLPDPKVTVLVYGTSRKGFREWDPIRLLFKEYIPSDYRSVTESASVWEKKPTYEDGSVNVQSRSTGTSVGSSTFTD